MTRPKPDIGHNSGGVASERLRAFIERIERLEEEKQNLQSDIRLIKSEAKSVGFDVKTINKIIAERKKSSAQVEEEQALLDIYRAALGMLQGTPLGEAAIKRLSPEEDQKENSDKKSPSMEISTGDIETARNAGSKAAADGKPVTDNPYPARDPRRAAWDEAWCAAIGSDGMEIPTALQRKKPHDKDKKSPEQNPDNENSGNDDDGQED